MQALPQRQPLMQGEQTALRLNANCEPWPVPADSRPEDCAEVGTLQVWSHHATLRRIGWIDQRGCVWLKIPPTQAFTGGSLTPLLIDVRDT